MTDKEEKDAMKRKLDEITENQKLFDDRQKLILEKIENNDAKFELLMQLLKSLKK